MKLTFLGAAREVTGSCYLLEIGREKVLIDCGMEQGPDLYENQALPLPPSGITAVLLTHAHIDHSGMLPALVAGGCQSKIYMTRATASLARIMLMDSAKIQEFEAEWRNRKSRRGQGEKYYPIYDSADVEKTLKKIRVCDYNESVKVGAGVKARFIDAGHLLGSASIELTATENGVTKVIVFSGDIGNKNKPIIRDPSYFEKADYAVTESTYGDRLNEHDVDYVKELTAVIQRTLDRGGNVIIPGFAVGRTQEILYHIRKIKEQKLIKNHDNFPVYIDSPLAVEATTVFSKHLTDCYDEETKTLLEKGVNPLYFDGLFMSVTTDESKMINADDVPKVIISASGMCEAGRIRHHLKHNLWRKESTVVFVGYQVQGTLGRIILDGAKDVKLFGEKVKVNAEIVQMKGSSSHADRDGLLEWAEHFTEKPEHVFVTHGDEKAAVSYAKLLESMGFTASAPYNGEQWDLAANALIVEGGREHIKAKTKKANGKCQEFEDLKNSVLRLQSVVASAADGTNENMRRLKREIDALCETYGLEKE